MKHELDWPDKPIPWQDRLPRGSRALTPVCDLCQRPPEPGSALCNGCADRVWCAERDAAETNEGEVR